MSGKEYRPGQEEAPTVGMALEVETAPTVLDHPLGAQEASTHLSSFLAPKEGERDTSERLRKTAEEVIDQIENTITIAVRQVDAQLAEVPLFHDPRWEAFLRSHEQSAKGAEEEYNRLQESHRPSHELAAAARRGRVEREVIRRTRELLERYATRDRFFARMMGDYEGRIAQTLGRSPSEQREWDFLHQALVDHGVSVAAYRTWLARERQRVLGDRSLGFVARQARALHLAHRGNLARAMETSDPLSKEEHREAVTEMQVDRATLEDVPHTIAGERELAEVSLADEEDVPTMRSDSSAQEGQGMVSVPQGEHLEQERPTIAPAESVPVEDEPERNPTLVALPEREAISHEITFVRHHVEKKRTEEEEPVRKNPESLVRPHPAHERRWRIFISRLGSEEDEDLDAKLRSMEDDYENRRIQLVENEGVMARPSSDGFLLLPEDPARERHLQSLIDGFTEAENRLRFVQGLRVNADVLLEREIEECHGNLADAEEVLESRRVELEREFLAALEVQGPGDAFTTALSERLIELRLALSALKKRIEEEKTGYIRTSDLESVSPEQETRASQEKVRELPRRRSWVSRFMKRLIFTIGLGVALPSDQAPSRESIEQMAPVPAPEYSPDSAGEEAQGDSGMEDADMGIVDDEDLEEAESLYEIYQLKAGETIWSHLRKMLETDGVRPTNERLVFLSRVVLDGNRLQHAEDISPNQEIDFTRAKGLIAKMDAGASVKELAQAAGYQGEIRL